MKSVVIIAIAFVVVGLVVLFIAFPIEYDADKTPVGFLDEVKEKEIVSDIDNSNPQVNLDRVVQSINNFEECIAAGNPAMESYPRQCRTVDGQHFVEIINEPSCDPSYPDVCITPYPVDLDCDEISYSNFRVIGNDPHGFDRDNDGIGCEVGAPFSSNTVESVPECDESYPDVCIPPYPPDLDCGEIGYSNFKVIGDDPHGFDGDNDGIGCES